MFCFAKFRSYIIFLYYHYYVKGQQQSKNMFLTEKPQITKKKNEKKTELDFIPVPLQVEIQIPKNNF